MIHSHSVEEDKFRLFITFLNRIIEGEIIYKDVVDPVIEETHLLATGKKTLSSIDRDKFPIIVYLNRRFHDIFKVIDPYSLHITNYKQIRDLFNQREVVSYE